MGLLNRMLNIVTDSVAKGVGDTLQKAVTDAVKPAAEKFAKKQAELIDEVSKNVESTTEAMKSAGDSINEAAAQTNPEDIKAAMEYLRKNADNISKEIENIETEGPLNDEAFLANWDEHLSDFPKWDVGGDSFTLEDLSEDAGVTTFRLHVRGVEANLRAYQAKLALNGFVPKWKTTTDCLYKEVNGRYPAMLVAQDDGLNFEELSIEVIFYYDTAEEIKRARY